MKTLLLALTTGAMVLFGTTTQAEARHRYNYGSRTFISYYSRCGCPVYATRYVAYYNRWGQPVWNTRTLPISHRCYRGYDSGYYPRRYDSYGSGYYNPRYSRGYYRPGITIRF